MIQNPSRSYRILSTSILILGLLLFLIYFFIEPSVLGPVFVAALVCILVEPIGTLFRRLGFFHNRASVLAIFLFSFIFFIVIYFAWPLLYRDSLEFLHSVNMEHVSEKLNIFSAKINTFLGFELDLKHQKNKIFSTFQSIDHLKLITNFILWVLVSPVFLYFFMVDSHKIRSSLFKLIPNVYFEIFSIIVYKIWFQVGAYLRARILEVAIISGISIFFFWVFNLPLPFLLGVFAGLLSLVPYVGPVIGAVPGVILAVSNDHVNLGPVLFVYLVINVLDMFVVFPLLMSKVAAIHPLMIIFSVLMGAKFFGIWGVLLAIPVSGAVYVTYRELKNYQYRDA